VAPEATEKSHSDAKLVIINYLSPLHLLLLLWPAGEQQHRNISFTTPEVFAILDILRSKQVAFAPVGRYHLWIASRLFGQ
jgi:hypothetical protein